MPFMLENFNHSVFSAFAARSDLSGFALLGPYMLAEWAILAGPALLVLLWIFGDTADRRSAVGASLAGLVALAAASLISSLFFHPRPFMDGQARNYLHHVIDSSFPSDHATFLFALAFAMGFSPPRSAPRLWFAIAGLAIIVAWARVYLGAHYPLDMAGAALIGFVSAAPLVTPLGLKFRDAMTQFGEWLYTLPTGRFIDRHH